MKTVFNNSMCAHVWAQRKQPHGRSVSMRFDGAVLYSYAEPVAHIVQPTNRAQGVALFTSKKWSVTTSAHISEAKIAASHYDQFEVPDLLLGRFAIANNDTFWARGHENNFAYLLDKYRAATDALMKCQAESWRLSNDSGAPSRPHVTLQAAALKITAYADAFGIAAPAPLPNWADDAEKALARRDRLLNDPKRQAKREASRVQREKAEERRALRLQEERRIQAEEAKLRVADWLAGGNRLHLMYGDVAGPYALLRVRGDVVESSRGAECPLPDAIQAIRRVRIVIARGESWRRNGETLPLGDFQVDIIAADGEVRAGCHRIQYCEIDRIGKELGV